jgi:mercuric ion transport protein
MKRITPAVSEGHALLVATLISAIGASICCVGPIVLLALGVGGVWIGSLTALEPYRPVFIGLTLLCLGFGFYRLYWAKPNFSSASGCANCHGLRRQRLGFWIVTALALGLIGISWLTPLFCALECRIPPSVGS